jgi:Icc-related predicted phosphoesterase
MFWRKSEPKTRIFFATDVHGSEQCFRKWLNAARVYGADVLILGGDITGKMLIPLTRHMDGAWYGEIHEEPVQARTEDELVTLQKRIRTMGRYDVLLTVEEKSEVDVDPARQDALFRQAIRESLERWVALAEERLSPTGIPSYMMLGNDDFPELVDVLRASSYVTHAEDDIYELPGGFELLSLGYSNPTPWHTPREVSEEELARMLEERASRLRDPHHAVFNLHCPPVGTHLDQAPLLDANLRPVVDTSGIRTTSVGSQVVREFITARQPLLGLHGHVHESPGAQKIGTSLCTNPGSDYGDGVLRGAIVDIDRTKGVRSWQIIQG